MLRFAPTSAAFSAALLALALTACTPADNDLAPGESGRIIRVASGDSLVLDSGLKVRLAGLEAPQRDEPKAAEARAALEKLALGRRATLRYGGQARLRSGAAVAHVFVTTEGGRRLWLQAEMLRLGWARVHTRRENHARAAPMLRLEAQARSAARGLWSLPDYAVRDAGNVGLPEHFVIVEGRVSRVQDRPDRTYLDFGQDYRADFSIVIAASDAGRFTGATEPSALVGARVRVRGYVRDAGGPLMRVDHPEQIEILSPELAFNRR